MPGFSLFFTPSRNRRRTLRALTHYKGLSLRILIPVVMEKTWEGGAANGEQGGRSVGALKKPVAASSSSLGNRLRPRAAHAINGVCSPAFFPGNSITRGWLDFILSVVSLQLTSYPCVRGSVVRSAEQLPLLFFSLFFKGGMDCPIPPHM